MSENSKIEWTDSTWNFLVGCDKVSAGCRGCYAIQTSWIRQHNPLMKEKFEGVVEKTRGGQLNWTGRVNISQSALMIPLKKKKPTKYFVNSLSDLFHDNVPFQVIDMAFAVMAIAMQHTFQILTKRPKRMLEYFSRPDLQDCIASVIADLGQHPNLYDTAAVASQSLFEDGLPLLNVHIGVSCEDQKTADERIPLLLQVPAAVRFLSCEPLLGPIDLKLFEGAVIEWKLKQLAEGKGPSRAIDWVIVGGESGPHARPMHPDWARSLRDQCQAAGVAFHFKQYGEWLPVDQPWKQDDPKRLAKNERWHNLEGGQGFHGDEVWRMRKVGKKAAGRLLDGRTWDEFPSVNNRLKQ